MKEYTTYELIEDQQGNLNLAIFFGRRLYH